MYNTIISAATKDSTDSEKEGGQIVSGLIVASSLLLILFYWILVYLTRKFTLFSQIYSVFFSIFLIIQFI